jgi:hypothetical protein
MPITVHTPVIVTTKGGPASDGKSLQALTLDSSYGCSSLTFRLANSKTPLVFQHAGLCTQLAAQILIIVRRFKRNSLAIRLFVHPSRNFVRTAVRICSGILFQDVRGAEPAPWTSLASSLEWIGRGTCDDRSTPYCMKNSRTRSVSAPFCSRCSKAWKSNPNGRSSSPFLPRQL